MTDYLWEQTECDQQEDDTISYKKMKEKFFNLENKILRERDRRKRVYYIFYLFRLHIELHYIVLCVQELNQNLNVNRQKFHNLITSLAMPAFDKKTEMVSL